jgi:hypothetical protein
MRDNSKIINNISTGNKGGGVAVPLSSANLVMKDTSEISNNTALIGGGVHAEGGSHIYMYDNSVIKDNISTGSETITSANGNNSVDGSGGGIYLRSSYLDMHDNSEISSNHSTSGNGGGIYAYHTITKIYDNSKISSNTANLDGGGWYDYDSIITLSGGTIYGSDGDNANKVGSLGRGTALYCKYSVGPPAISTYLIYGYDDRTIITTEDYDGISPYWNGDIIGHM